jgi:hypothetical protein
MGKKIAIAFAIVLLLVVVVGQLVSKFLLKPQEDTEKTLKGNYNSVQDAETTSTNATLEDNSGLQRQRIEVISVEGVVEHRLGKAHWVLLQSGDRLQQEEAIRTGKEGRAMLKVGDTATVEITPRSHFSVKEVSHTVARVQLDVGRVFTVVHGKGGSKFRIEMKGSDAFAESSKGEFSVLTRGDGQIAVAARAGNVQLSAKNKNVKVAAGTQSLVQPNLPPTTPEPIPASLFLKVVGSKSKLQREKKTTIEGSTTPGAMISVNGVNVPVNKEGGFSALVPLKEGTNPIVIETEDVSGRRKKELSKITVKSKVSEVRSKARPWGSKD